MKNLVTFFKKHGVSGLGIIRRYIILKTIYEPLKIKEKLMKINGYKLLLDFRTEGISKGLYVMNSREILETEVVSENIKDGDVCLDAGSNIGYYAFLEASKKNTKVYSFEPDKRNLDILKKGIEINGFNNIELFNKALSNKVGKEKLFLSDKSNINSMIGNFSFLNGKYHTVNTETIDNFCKNRKIDFIRMDIEGFEYEVFCGMEELIKSNKPLKIMVEVHNEHYSKNRDFSEKIKLLGENKFKIKYLVTQEKPHEELFNSLGYKPIKIINDSPNLRALYGNIKFKDASDLIKKDNYVRALFFERKDIK